MPRRGERFADGAVEVVWAAIMQLPPASQWVLLGELRVSLAASTVEGGGHSGRMARLAASLQEAAEIRRERGEEGPLSADAYGSLFAVFGRRAGWVPGSTLRRWVGGSWNDCLREAGLEVAPDGDVVIAEIGGAFTEGEIVAAVTAYAAETVEPRPTLTGYVRWSKRADVRARAGRRPASQGPFDRVFGGFGNALARAGVAAEGEPVRMGAVSGLNNVRAASGYGYPDERIADALREIAGRLGRSPRTTEYQHERARLLAEERAAGKPPRAIPSYSLIQGRFACWENALVFAGLMPLSNARRGPRKWKPEEMCDALRRAFADLGHPFTVTRYTRWRQQQIAAALARGHALRIPTHYPIWMHFGSWPQACAAAALDATGGPRGGPDGPGADRPDRDAA